MSGDGFVGVGRALVFKGDVTSVFILMEALDNASDVCVFAAFSVRGDDFNLELDVDCVGRHALDVAVGVGGEVTGV